MPNPAPGDRVRHRKYGVGTVKAYYPKNDGVRVKYDSGHETVNARKRLLPVNELSGEQRQQVEEPRQDIRVRRSSSAGASTVDYKALEAAQRHFEKQFPDAHKVVPKIYGTRVYCEVWTEDGHAKNYFMDDDPVPEPKKKKRRSRAPVTA